MQLHDELAAGLEETQLALEHLQPTASTSFGPAKAYSPLHSLHQSHHLPQALQPINQLCRSASSPCSTPACSFLKPNPQVHELLIVDPGS